IPQVEWAVRTMAEGVLPQWIPFRGFGAPFLSDPSFQFFYPLSVVTWVMPARAAYSVLVVAHALLGAIGAYRLLARRLRSVPAGVIGAIVFVGCGPLASSANLWHHFCSAMWMPWVLDAFLRVRARRSGIAPLAFTTGMQALAGSADVCIMT